MPSVTKGLVAPFVWPPTTKTPPLWNLGSFAVVASVGILSKIFMKTNNITVKNKDVLLDALMHRKPGQPLITVSNHKCNIDDPLLWGILPPEMLLNPKAMRWTLAAKEICFPNQVVGRLFALGKVIPCIRGEGVFQRGIDFAVERLNQGDWIHVFSEGKVNMLQDELLPLRWGVGRMVLAPEATPIVIPLIHVGMQNVVPMRRPYIPRPNQRVELHVGDPLTFTKESIAFRNGEEEEVVLRKRVTDMIEKAMRVIDVQAREAYGRT